MSSILAQLFAALISLVILFGVAVLVGASAAVVLRTFQAVMAL